MKDDFLASFEKVVGVSLLIDRLNQWRAAGDKIVFTNGVFDIIHRGHLYSLQCAKSFGDRLIVGVNSDRSARGLGKGSDRPYYAEADRAELLAGFEVVDAVVLFDQPTPLELVKLVRPDVLVKGGDYELDAIVGREFAGRVERVQLLNGYSTSSLIARIRRTADV